MGAQIPDAETIRAFNTGIIDEFRSNDGKVGGYFENAELILLTTTGAKTGQPRLVVLTPVRIDGRMLIVGSLAGADTDPAWAHNLRANPRAQVELGAETFEASAEELSRAERDALWPAVIAAQPVYAEYQAQTERVIPLFELRRG